jgi:tetratricopeptide (TPR) repeat protein
MEVERQQKRLLQVARQLQSDLPGNEDALTLMGIVYHGIGKNNLALECWQRALSINPRQPDILYNMGLIAMQQEQYGDAISYWEKALKMNPKMAGPNLAIGRALLVQGRHEQAVQAFGKELALAPKSIQCHHLLAQAYALLEDHTRAKEHYLRVLASEPNHVDAHYGLFQACSRLGEKEQAKTYVARFRQLKSQTQHRGRDIDTSTELAQVRISAMRMYLGVSEVYIGSGNYKKATNVLMEALRVDPNQVACLKKLTTVYQRIGRPEAALETSQRVTVLEPKDPMGFLVMGTLALQLNRFDQAESALRRAVELAPRASVGYRELAKLHLKANLSTAQARVYAQKAVALQQTAENYYILSVACARGGDKNTALVAIRQAMKRAPDNTLYRKMYDQIRRQP